MKWWMDHKFRMVQNNLRDIDGSMDVDLEISMLKKFHANVVQVGCGGISAFSDTGLDCQKKTPFLQGDKFGELVEKCHAENIRVIARFDVSKVHQSFEASHPEWLQRTGTGEAVHYNDTVLTCVNGPYQQEKTLEIIGEILNKYPVDGIFFNMFGYQTHDYSGNYVGICQCENCRKRFRELFGEELPDREDESSPVFQKYQEFKKITVDQLLRKIQEGVKRISPDIALSTYFDQGVDIIRCESNTAVDRPLPLWIYSASDNVSSIEGTFADKVSSNCAINAVDIPYRFMGVSDTFNRIRMYENMANGGNLDWCIIGSFEDYPDRSNYKGVETVFSFHEQYQDIFDCLHSAARVLLIRPGAPYLPGNYEEYRGIFRMLKEAHIPFDTLIDLDTEQYRNHPANYDLIIVPGIARLKSEKLRAALLKTRASVIATGGSFAEDRELLERYFGIAKLTRHQCVRGAYYKTVPKTVFHSFADQDWVYQDRSFWTAEPADGSSDSQPILPYISPAVFGPPERCYGHRTTDIPSAVIGPWGISILWEVGTLYYTQGYEAFKQIFLDLMDQIRGGISALMPFVTDAHESMEMFYGHGGDHTDLIQLINLSGFSGVTVGRPVPQKNIRITLKKTPVKVEELTPEGIKEVAHKGNSFSVEECGLYKAYRIQY